MDERTNKRTIFYHDPSGYYSSTDGDRTTYADYSEYINALADYLKPITLGDIFANILFDPFNDPFTESDRKTNAETD
jgi:hypothetical protein